MCARATACVHGQGIFTDFVKPREEERGLSDYLVPSFVLPGAPSPSQFICFHSSSSSKSTWLPQLLLLISSFPIVISLSVNPTTIWPWQIRAESRPLPAWSLNTGQPRKYFSLFALHIWTTAEILLWGRRRRVTGRGRARPSPIPGEGTWARPLDCS